MPLLHKPTRLLAPFLHKACKRPAYRKAPLLLAPLHRKLQLLTRLLCKPRPLLAPPPHKACPLQSPPRVIASRLHPLQTVPTAPRSNLSFHTVRCQSVLLLRPLPRLLARSLASYLLLVPALLSQVHISAQTSQ